MSHFNHYTQGKQFEHARRTMQRDMDRLASKQPDGGKKSSGRAILTLNSPTASTDHA